MALNKQQFAFTHAIALLVLFAYSKGYTLTYSDAYATDGHIDGSKHYDRLAVDFNLFRDGVLLTKTLDYKFLGIYWESLDPEATWGGFWNDGCHFSWGEYERK